MTVNSHNINTPLFQKYSISIDHTNGDRYVIKKYRDDGSKHEIMDESEREEILAGEALKGGIGFTKDKRHKGWLHKLLYIAQRIHTLFTKGHLRADSAKEKNFTHSCHGFIILGSPRNSKGELIPPPKEYADKPFHAWMTVDPLFNGIMRRCHDNLRDKNDDVTKLYIYLPRDPALGQLVAKNSLQSSFPMKSSIDKDKPIEEWKCYDRECITDEKKKLNFSVKKLLTCLFYNGKNPASSSPKPRVIHNTAALIADLLISGTTAALKGDDGKSRSFFCCSYVTTMLTISILQRDILKLSDEEKERFLCDDEKKPLSREKLVKKIEHCFLNGDTEDGAMERQFHAAFHAHKFSQVDTEYLSSGHFVALANECSYKSSNK